MSSDLTIRSFEGLEIPTSI
jgi:hypothetical protein